MTKYVDHIEQERRYTAQELIDRMLYLPEDKRVMFMVKLNALFNEYSIDVEVIDGIRIYKIKQNANNNSNPQRDADGVRQK